MLSGNGFLSGDELRRFFEALDSVARYARLLPLSLLTGARRSMSRQWHGLNLICKRMNG